MSTGESASQNSSKLPTPALEDGPPTTKKRKIAVRACDFCRRKKIKCDAPSEAEGGKCTACLAHNHDCTFVENAKRRGTPKGYVDYLEHRIDRLEDVLRRMLPSFDIVKHIGRRASQASWVEDREAHTPLEPVTVSSPPTRIQPSEVHRTTQTNLDAPASSSLEPGREEGPHPERPEDALTESLSQLKLGNEPYFGQASGVDLMAHARNVKSWSTGRREPPKTKDPDHQSWGESSWGSLAPIAAMPIDRLKFPPQELLQNLVGLYFRYFHPFLPTLHQPTFEGQLRKELHKTDVSFARQVLLVCAVGSRWSGDPRVCEAPESLQSATSRTEWRAAGWRYFVQVVDFPLPFNPTIRLLDLQNTLLYGFCVSTTRAPMSPWLWAGTGVRCAMHMGAHRQKTYGSGHSLLKEMWKRTFWCLVNLDRAMSVSLGRPPAVNDEDVDVELPLEIDDDSLSDSLPRNQVGDKPSQMQFFTQWTKLGRIAVNAMKTIYGTSDSKAQPHSAGEEHQKSAVSELDRTLNDWLAKVPPHLRWNPNIANPTFFEQSANLNIYYQHVRILIHRPFLPGTKEKISSLSYSSLAICTDAARSISHVLEAHLKRVLASEGSSDASQMVHITPLSTGGAFLAGIVLLIAIWRLKMTGGNIDATTLAQDMQKIMEYLSYAKKRIYTATSISDTLNELASAGGLPMNSTHDAGPAKASLKRSRSDGKVHVPEQDPSNAQPACACVADPPLEDASLQGLSVSSQNVEITPSVEASSTLRGALCDPIMASSHVGSAAINTDFGDLLNSALNGSQLFQTRTQSSWLDLPDPATINSYTFGFPNCSAYPPSSHLLPENIAAPGAAVDQQPAQTFDFVGDHSLPTRARWDDAFYSVTAGSTLVRNPHEVTPDTNWAESGFDPGAMDTSTWGTSAAAFTSLNSFGPEHSQSLPPNLLSSTANVDWMPWVTNRWGMYGTDSLVQGRPDFPPQEHPAS